MATIRIRNQLKLLSKSQMDEYAYEAEVLPEIEIREIMSLEELMAFDTSFVAFSESEILQYMSQLVQDTHRGKVFNQLFQQLRSLPEHPSTEFMIPILDTEVENKEDELYDILQAIIDTKNAPNYVSQLNEIYKLTYPLTIVPNAPPPHLPLSDVPRTVGLRDTNKTYVLLPRDIAYAKQTVVGSVYRIPITTRSSYVHERTNASFVPVPEDLTHAPSFDEVVDGVIAIADVHTLRVHFERFGYDIDRLSEPQLKSLITRLQSLSTQEKHNMKKTYKSVSPSQRPVIQRENMWKMFENMLEQKIDADKFLVMWEMLPSTTQLVAPAVQVPNDIADIAMGISEAKFTLEDVVASLKYTRALSEYQQVRQLLEDFQALNPEEAQSHLVAMSEKWSAIFSHYVDRMPSEFLATHREMAEIKEGADTSSYLGDPPTAYFEDASVPVDTTVDATYEEAEVDADIATRLDPLPTNLHSLSEGTREILEIILPIIQRIQRASGVPCNFDSLVNWLSTKIIRVSRKEYISSNVLGLSTQIRNQIIHMDMDRALHVASMVTPHELSLQLRDVIKVAWKAWEDDIDAITNEALAWWVLETQENALDRTLAFDVTQGSFACLQKWSPWGPPLQADKGEGVLEYLLCVAHDIGVTKTSVDIMKRKLLQIIEEEPRTTALKAKFKDIGKDVPIMSDRAKAANLSLAEAIENKQKNRYLPEFVKTYMLLPGLIAGQPKLSSGCCLQKIGAEFSADSDWRGVLKRLRDVKDAFAKKRMTMAEMPQLTLFERPASTETLSPSPMVLPTTIPLPSKLRLEEWLSLWDSSATVVTFVSQDMLRTAMRDMNQGLAHAEKFLKMAKTTAKIKLDIFEFLKDKATWSHFEQIFNLVLHSLHQSRAKSVPESREQTILQSYISEVVQVKQHFQQLQGIWDDVDMSIVRPLFTYVIARTVCLPAVPEASTTQQLALTEAVSTGFLSNTLKMTLDKLKKYIATNVMPTMEQQAAFITEMREQQKVEVLAFLDEKNVDDRQLLADMKKLGLTTFVKKPEATTADDNENAEYAQDAQYEAEGERDFAYHAADADTNDLNNFDI